jgi:putative ABC transport system permease protein
MRLADTLRIAMSNLWKRKLRTTLTVFAVVIGATLIALMVSLGVGLQDYVTGQLRSLSVPDVISVEPKSSLGVASVLLGATGFGAPQEVQEGQVSPYLNIKSLTGEDVERIRAVGHVDAVEPLVYIMPRWVQMEGDEKKYQLQLLGSPNYEIRQRKLDAGRPFERGERGVAVVAHDFLETWGLSDPQAALGRTISIRVPLGYQINPLSSREPEGQDFQFEIIGVFQDSILSTEVAVPMEDAITMARYFNEDDEAYTQKDMGLALSVHVDDPDQVNAVAREIESLGDYAAETPEESASSLAGGFRAIQAVLSIFGLIALAVASLSIINTLIMATYERTREIGVMKAVGASKGTIRLLFTVEAGSIGFWGGVIGLAVAWILGMIVNVVSHLTFLRDYKNFDISVFPLWLVLAVIALTTCVALVAGLLPATRAANLDPVEALRYE